MVYHGPEFTGVQRSIMHVIGRIWNLVWKTRDLASTTPSPYWKRPMLRTAKTSPWVTTLLTRYAVLYSPVIRCLCAALAQKKKVTRAILKIRQCHHLTPFGLTKPCLQSQDARGKCTYAGISYESLVAWTAIHPESVVDEDVRNIELPSLSQKHWYTI